MKPIQPPIGQATISPSDLPGPKALPGELNAHQVDDLLEEGTKLHLLLEHLPKVPSSERQKLGEQLVEKKHARFITTAIALIEDPKLQQIWTSNALTEVDVTAEVAGLGRIFGAIDRLIVTPDLVQIIDFKSNRSVPSKFSETPLGVVNQIAAYYACVRQIYPDREVKAFILWTQTGDLMEFPQQYIHDALKALTSP